MKTINLTQGYSVEVDDEDYLDLIQYSWHAHIGKSKVHAVRTYRKIDGKQTTITMPRHILGLTDSETSVLYIDRNGLNCRRSNLIIANRSKSAGYCKKKKGTTSKYKGVSWSSRRNLWKASINYHGKTICLGFFKVEIEAAKKRDEYSRLYFGKTATLNN